MVNASIGCSLTNEIARFDDHDIGENIGPLRREANHDVQGQIDVFLPCAILTLLAASSRQDTMAGDQERDIGSASSGARQRPPIPAITGPVMFNTAEADRILTAMQVFPVGQPVESRHFASADRRQVQKPDRVGRSREKSRL